jgi:hypothetical protein
MGSVLLLCPRGGGTRANDCPQLRIEWQWRMLVDPGRLTLWIRVGTRDDPNGSDVKRETLDPHPGLQRRRHDHRSVAAGRGGRPPGGGGTRTGGDQ